MTTTTPNMNLVLPDVLGTVGPSYAYYINAAQYLIDSHDHSTGQGVRITPAGINISSDLTFAQNNATNLRTLRLYNNTSLTPGVSDRTCMYSLNNELHYIDGAGNDIQLTLNGSIDLSGTIALITIKDANFTLQYFGDTTKQMNFNLSAIPTSTTRVMSVPDSGANDTFVTLAATQTITNKTLTLPRIATLTPDGSNTVTLPTITDTLAGLTATQTLTNKTLGSTNTATGIRMASFTPDGSNTLTLPTATDTVAVLAATQTLTNKSLGNTTVVRSASELRFNNSGNTFYTSLKAGANAANYAATLPLVDGANGQSLITDGSGNWGWANNGSQIANVAANDSNVTFVSTDNHFQVCNPTANRTYTLPATGATGDTWIFENRATTAIITLQTSNTNSLTTIMPQTAVTVVALSTTPTANTNWIRFNTSTSQVKGITTGGSPLSGYLGERLVATVSTVTNVPGATGVAGNMTSVSLTAGVWDIALFSFFTLNGAVMTGQVQTSIVSASATNGSPGDTSAVCTTPTGANDITCVVPTVRVSLSSTTTYYATANCTYSAGNPQYQCRISAVRVA